MKHLLFATALTFAFYACGDGTADQNMDTTEGTPTEVTTEDQALQPDVRTFVEEAASGGMMEVQLGQMAQEKGSSQEVKDFGQMMVQDHGKANQQLQSIAQNLQMQLPQAMLDKHQQHVTELQNLSGADFDREYMSMMVEDHQEDISKFLVCAASPMKWKTTPPS